MGKEQEILRQSSNNMLQSIGRGSGPQAMPQPVPLANAAKLQGVARNVSAVEIAIERITADQHQPRKSFAEEEIAELGASMREQGQLQPILVRWEEKEQLYVIVAGERRWRAAKNEGLKTLKCTLADEGLTESQLRIIQLTENCLRKDLNPLEQAKAFKALMEENSWTERDLAKHTHLNQSTVHRTLVLLLLPEEIQEKVIAGMLSASAAAEIAKVKDEGEQKALAEKVLTEGLTRDDTAQVVRVKTGRKPRVRSDEDPTPRPTGTTFVYTVPLGKISIFIAKQPATNEDALNTLKQLLVQLEAQQSLRSSRSEAA